jgi:predicted anti-sigma-YlaC factor YlaD
MSMTLTVKEKICERNLIAAYIDGELDADLTQLFEEHLESCAACRAELRAHRMFVCELDAALTDRAEMPVPADFSRRVAVRATTDMRGVRTGSEHRKALSICLALALVGFALVGSTARHTIFLIAGKVVSQFVSVIGFVASIIYDVGAGLTIVAGILSRKVINETGALWPMLVLVAFGLLILARLIFKYHRTGATE